MTVPSPERPPDAPTAGSRTAAAIDIGTNSFHMVVARSLPKGGFDIITTEKEMVRLGEGAGEMKRLSEAAIDRGVDAIGRMVAVAASHDAAVTAVATSAVREAENADDFIDRVADRTGLKIEVISGIEEARLIHLGVLQALPVFDKRLLMIDIGGGSTEFLVGDGETVLAARSVKLGSIRLTDMFFADIDPESGRRKQVKGQVKAAAKCRKHVRNILTPVANDLAPLGHVVAVGCSGTITTVAQMALTDDLSSNQASVAAGDRNGSEDLTLTATGLDRVVSALIDEPYSQRSRMPGLDAKRVDIILAGALLLQGAFELFGIQTLTVSPFALREGVLYDRLEIDRSGDRLADLRRSNAWRLAHQLDPDAVHAETCARHALRLFDATGALHRFGAWERQLLEMAALVHNVGLFLSHAAHHKHSYYIVRHSELLTGFTNRERELLAQVARYHRKSHPSVRKHQEFGLLNKADQHRVRVLAGLLRVAIGLDRGHNQAVAELDANHDGEELRIQIQPRVSDADLSLEVYAAQERSQLLAASLDVTVRVSAVSGRAERHQSEE